MKAAEARTTANAVKRAEEAEKTRKHLERRAALKKSIPAMRVERIIKIEKQFRDRIKWAVEEGERKTAIVLSSDHHDSLRGEYKYLPTRKEKYGSGRTWHYSWGEGYLKYAPWGKYVKLVLTKLRRDGYACVIEAKSIQHDDSAAYLNSGGECGSETPYWTQDTVLTISW